MQFHARVYVSVRNTEQVTHLAHPQPGLLLNFAFHPLLGRFVAVAEAARQVKCPLCRFFGAACHQNFTLAVHYNAHRRSQRVEVIDKTTFAAALRLEIILVEIVASAFGAMTEKMKWMWHIRVLLCLWGVINLNYQIIAAKILIFWQLCPFCCAFFTSYFYILNNIYHSQPFLYIFHDFL